MFIYFWGRERERECVWAGVWGTERDTHTESEAQDPTRGSNSQAARSWPESKSDVQLTEPPKSPRPLILLNRLYFLEQFLVHKKNWVASVESAHVPSDFTHLTPSLLSTSPTRASHVLQSLSLHGYIIIIPKPYFILVFTLGVVHSVDFDQYIMTCITIIVSYRIVSLP